MDRMLKILLLSAFVSTVLSRNYPTIQYDDKAENAKDDHGLINEDVVRSRYAKPAYQTQVQYNDEEDIPDLIVEDDPGEKYEYKSASYFPKRSTYPGNNPKPEGKQGNYKGTDTVTEIKHKKHIYENTKIDQEEIEVKSDKPYGARLPRVEQSEEPKVYKSTEKLPSKGIYRKKPSEEVTSEHAYQTYPKEGLTNKPSYKAQKGGEDFVQTHIDVDFKPEQASGKGKDSSVLPQQIVYESGMRPGHYGHQNVYMGHSNYKAKDTEKDTYKKVADYQSPSSYGIYRENTKAQTHPSQGYGIQQSKLESSSYQDDSLGRSKLGESAYSKGTSSKHYGSDHFGVSHQQKQGHGYSENYKTKGKTSDYEVKGNVGSGIHSSISNPQKDSGFVQSDVSVKKNSGYGNGFGSTSQKQSGYDVQQKYDSKNDGGYGIHSGSSAQKQSGYGIQSGYEAKKDGGHGIHTGSSAQKQSGYGIQSGYEAKKDTGYGIHSGSSAHKQSGYGKHSGSTSQKQAGYGIISGSNTKTSHGIVSDSSSKIGGGAHGIHSTYNAKKESGYGTHSGSTIKKEAGTEVHSGAHYQNTKSIKGGHGHAGLGKATIFTNSGSSGYGHSGINQQGNHKYNTAFGYGSGGSGYGGHFQGQKASEQGSFNNFGSGYHTTQGNTKTLGSGYAHGSVGSGNAKSKTGGYYGNGKVSNTYGSSGLTNLNSKKFVGGQSIHGSHYGQGTTQKASGGYGSLSSGYHSAHAGSKAYGADYSQGHSGSLGHQTLKTKYNSGSGVGSSAHESSKNHGAVYKGSNIGSSILGTSEQTGKNYGSQHNIKGHGIKSIGVKSGGSSGPSYSGVKGYPKSHSPSAYSGSYDPKHVQVKQSPIQSTYHPADQNTGYHTIKEITHHEDIPVIYHQPILSEYKGKSSGIKGGPKEHKYSTEYKGIGGSKAPLSYGHAYSEETHYPSKHYSIEEGSSLKDVPSSLGVSDNDKKSYDHYPGKSEDSSYKLSEYVTADKYDPKYDHKDSIYKGGYGSPDSGTGGYSSGYSGSHGSSYSGPVYGSDDKYESSRPMPYEFKYEVTDEEHGSDHYREEKMDDNGYLTGRYGYKDPHGLYRQVEYQAGKEGFKVSSIKTNEPGTDNQDPADVHFEVEKNHQQHY